MSDDILDRAADAALALAADRPWKDIALLDIARAAEVPFAELYAKAPSKAALVMRIARRFDRAALASPSEETDAVDRLFEACMARLEAMEPHRAVLIAIARAEPAPLAARLPFTARALLEASGIDTSGARGAARLAAMTAVWARILQVWRDDEGALNRTMAELDKRLKQMRTRLGRIGAGF
jgi:hypothetical protein